MSLEAANILRHLKVSFEEDIFYVHSGHLVEKKGWIFYLSTVPNQFELLLTTILPELAAKNIAFKVIKDTELLINLNDGSYGAQHIGRAVSIYPNSESEAVALYANIGPQLQTFIGPKVLSDFSLGNNMYCRYGGFGTFYALDLLSDTSFCSERGDFVEDNYANSAVLPEGVANPFTSQLKIEGKSSLIGRDYLQVEILKADQRGNVIKALRWKGWKIRWCVIKHGRACMHLDANGRDMRDRLLWQLKVHEQLQEFVALPHIVEYFNLDGDGYLVMQYMRGSNLKSVAVEILNHRAWYSLPDLTQTEMLNCLEQVVKNVICIHSRGFIHRDLTGTNFLLHKGKISLIDLELFYDLKCNEPNPPFLDGTTGYMSPQQAKGETPSVKDDVYSLGALIIMFLTGIEPLAVVEDEALLREKLYFLIQNDKIVELILSCLSLQSQVRPNMDSILGYLDEIKSDIRQRSPGLPHRVISYSREEIKQTVQQALFSLSEPALMANGVWSSDPRNMDIKVGATQQNRIKINNPFVFHGVAGIQYLLSIAGRLGYDISRLRNIQRRGWDYIFRNTYNDSGISQPGLFAGAAGIALSMMAAFGNGDLPCNEYYLTIIKSFLESKDGNQSMMGGLAGQGMAFLLSGEYVDQQIILQQTSVIAEALVNQQGRDGSWVLLDQGSRKPKMIKGFAYGISGILYFLLEFGYRFSNERALQAVKWGLSYLRRRQDEKSDNFWWLGGTTGIALTFLKAYERMNMGEYLLAAEGMLKRIPKNILHFDLTQSEGLAGLGEVYLEAYRITKAEEWQERAAWIAYLIMALRMRPKSGHVYWLVKHPDYSTGDLMMGRGGVMHFLLHYLHPEQMGFPCLY